MKNESWIVRLFTKNRMPIFQRLSVLDLELNNLRERHRYLSERVRVGSDESFGEIFEAAVEELERVEIAGRALVLERERLVDALNAIQEGAKASPPPQLGERMLLLILRTKEERANIPGDLEEEFAQIAAKHGARFANVWYYKQVAASTWPLVRKAVRWGLLASIGEWIRRAI